MRRCHFLGPRFFFFFFSRRRQPDPLLLPPLHSVSLASHLQTVCRGFFPVLAPGAPGGRLTRHLRKDRSDPPWRGRVCPGWDRATPGADPLLCCCLSLQPPDPGREARGPRPPRRRGLGGGLRLVCISRPRPPPPPWFVPILRPARTAVPRSPGRRTRLPASVRWPPSHPAVLWASPPAC